ncbi:MAG: hypothetical protein HQK99_16070 [Nitrospirae bacterium]|nr:hypothetical protein [Nitrospirota bacterium]
MNNTQSNYNLRTLASHSNITEAKIADFNKIEKGWHYGEGGPIEEKIIRDAIRINSAALEYGFSETNAFPGVYGEIQLCIYHDNHYLEFMIYADERVLYVYELDDVEVLYKENLNIEEAVNEVRVFGRMLCGSSDLSTKNIMTQKSSVLLVRPSRVRATILGSR